MYCHGPVSFQCGFDGRQPLSFAKAWKRLDLELVR
jgi:hypothetical protein